MEVVANKYKVIAYCYCIMGGGDLTVHKVDCLGEETVLVPDCPCNQKHIASHWSPN